MMPHAVCVTLCAYVCAYLCGCLHVGVGVFVHAWFSYMCIMCAVHDMNACLMAHKNEYMFVYTHEKDTLTLYNYTVLYVCLSR